MQDLGTLGGIHGRGVAINSAGQVTGQSTTNAASHAFLWDGTAMLDLGTLGGTGSFGTDINDAGQVTGASGMPGDVGIHAFLWDGTAMQDLGTLGGLFSQPTAINSAGQITGQSATNAGGNAFLWDGTAMRDLGTLGGTVSFGTDINDAGQVTGFALTSDTSVHAFLWDGTEMLDLNSLVETTDPLQPFVTLLEGIDINDLGQILAHGTDSRTGQLHAYVVSPIPNAYSFSGFFPPVDNPPTLNIAKAGTAIPVKFSLSGDQGLAIFDSGYPVSRSMTCDGSAPSDVITETVTAGASTLSYDATLDQYTYVWKTDKDWKGTCRQLIVRLNDLSEHVANFKFK